MFRDGLVKLEKPYDDGIIRDINTSLEGSSFEPQKVDIFSCELPFYPGYRFLEISDHNVTPIYSKNIVYKANDVHILNGSNDVVYALNKEVPIQLCEENICFYVHFFFSYVRGKKGYFIVVQKVDDIPWNEDPPPSARKAISDMIGPIQLLRKEKDKDKDGDTSREGLYFLEAYFQFKDSLFKSQVTVNSEGMVHVSQEELLIEEMPVLDDTLGF